MLSTKVKNLFVQALTEKFDSVSRIESTYDFVTSDFTICIKSPLTGNEIVLFKNKNEKEAEKAFADYSEAFSEWRNDNYPTEYQIAEEIFDQYAAEVKEESLLEYLANKEIITQTVKLDDSVMNLLTGMVADHIAEHRELAELNDDSIRVLEGKKYKLTPSGKSNVTAGVLALLFGGLGIHRFYLGQIGLGFLMMIVTFVCMFFGLFFIPIIWMLIDAVMMFMANKEDFAKKYSSWVVVDSSEIKNNVDDVQVQFMNMK
ncbi:hypothetical protein M977_04342 [Buttiauxella gaviniae ATCC 51604]|uniref:TM2 domain-containing protein n=1 Tax=Buttiauxella gaviniae ATCC 51604 TaxID=1354253 RepID=A0A1B7HN82_9ENTR|nr:TM2 domain-containing protein [Buttiauxella gaviniae]OAT17096.1 hypothetical protein M977_04342 [Buttiauxella gaviniae ATCC 51604]